MGPPIGGPPVPPGRFPPPPWPPRPRPGPPPPGRDGREPIAAFAVFGIKGLLRRQIEEQRRTNELLASVAQRQQIVADTYAVAPGTVVRERPVVPPL